MGILRMATRLGDTALQHLYVSGPGDPNTIESISGQRTLTLSPCDECRPLLREHSAVAANLPITTAAADGYQVERHTLTSIMDAYQNVSPPLTSAVLLAQV
jgi:cytidine deaminase